MLFKNTNSSVGVCLTVLSACTMLAGVWMVLEAPETALAKKPDSPPGGDKTTVRLARIAFTNSPRIQSDGVAMCGDWDYWDERDLALQCSEGMQCRVDVSGGGRVKFGTAWQADDNSGSPRWLTLNFNDGGSSNQNPNIDALIYQDGYHNNPPVNPELGCDNVKTGIGLDRMFKNTATRQPLVISIVVSPDGDGWPPSGYSLRRREDLYIVETADPDVRTLKTGELEGERLADLVCDGVVVGTYTMPLEWTMQLVPLR